MPSTWWKMGEAAAFSAVTTDTDCAESGLSTGLIFSTSSYVAAGCVSVSTARWMSTGVVWPSWTRRSFFRTGANPGTDTSKA